MDRHEKFLRLAIEEAHKSVEEGQTPFGAVITQNDELVVATHNSVVKDCDCTAHAEINAVRKACKKLQTIDLSGCVLYSSCEPCPMCFSAIHWAKIHAIYSSASIKDAQNAGFSELEISNTEMKKKGGSSVLLHNGLLKEEGLKPFKVFIEKEDKITY